MKKATANSLLSTATTTLTGTDSEAPKYVDRAAARREAFNQPEQPTREGYKKKIVINTTGEAKNKAVPVVDARDGIEESNVGSKMLEKMVCFA